MTEDLKDGPGGHVYSPGLGIRHLQVMVLFMASCVAYVLRANLSITIVAMVDKHDPEPLAPTYDWDEKLQGYVLSSFFWGYLITQIPSGVLTERFGGHRFLCASILGSSLLTLVFPQCVYLGGWMSACGNRMLLGLTQGFTLPSVFTLLGVWVPPTERSTLSTIALSAALLGAVLSSPLSGFLCSAFGWPCVFYILGSIGLGFGIAMIFLGSDYPSTHRMISLEEKHYIQMSLGGAKEKVMVPWSSIATSVPYFAAVCTYIFKTAINTTLLTKIPTFLATVLKFGLKGNGILSALPFLISWILSFVFSWICDFLIRRDWLELTAARKIFNSIATCGAAVFILLLAHSDNRNLSVFYLTMTIGCTAGSYSGVQAGFVDMAPNFSGPIYSVANFLGACLGLCGPIITGHIVTESGSADQWRIVFYIFAFLWASSNAVYVILGSSETQFWNWPQRYTDAEDFKYKSKKNELDKQSAC